MRDRLFKFATTYRVHITFVVIVPLLALLWYEHVLPRDPAALGDPVALLGLVLSVAGVLMRSWAAGIVHKNKVLATAGPYALARHPLYLGSTGMALGLAVILSDARAIGAVLALLLLIYIPKMKAEERVLEGIFPAEYAAYRQRTGLFWPRTVRPALGAPWSFASWRKNREYKASLTVLAMLVILHLIAGGLGGT